MASEGENVEPVHFRKADLGFWMLNGYNITKRFWKGKEA
jgi:hypothetical protein